jgi:hypothetical protein
MAVPPYNAVVRRLHTGPCTWVYGICSGFLRYIQNHIAAQVGLPCRRRPYAEGFISQPNKLGLPVCLAEDCYCGDAQPLCSDQHPAGNLSPVGKQLFGVVGLCAWLEVALAGARKCHSSTSCSMCCSGASSCTGKRCFSELYVAEVNVDRSSSYSCA